MYKQGALALIQQEGTPFSPILRVNYLLEIQACVNVSGGEGGGNKVQLPIYQVNWPPVFLMSMFRVNDRDGRSDRSLKANILSSLQAAISMKASQLPNGHYPICTRSSHCVNRLTMYVHFIV